MVFELMFLLFFRGMDGPKTGKGLPPSSGRRVANVCLDSKVKSNDTRLGAVGKMGKGHYPDSLPMTG